MIEKYLSPPADIIEALQDLFVYFQLQNPTDPANVLNYQKTGNFSGSIQDYHINEAHAYLDVQRCKPWEYLTHSLFYLANIDDKVTIPKTITSSQVPEYLALIQKGLLAHLKLKAWMDHTPILHDQVSQIFEEKFGWHIFNVGNVTLTDGPIAIYDEIMDIDDPLSFVSFLRQQNRGSSLFIAIQRQKEFWWRGGFYFFLTVNGKIYSIDNMERRLNQMNTAGARNPDKYLEHNWVFSFLPYDLLVPLDQANDECRKEAWFKAREKALSIHDGRKVRPIAKVSSYGPSFKAVLECFVMRSIYEINRASPSPGIAGTEQLLLTAGTPTYTPARVPGSAGDYLLSIYSAPTESLTIDPDRLAMVIDTPEWHQKVVAYVQEKSYADRLQEITIQDYRDNYPATKIEIQAFFDSFTPRKDYFIEKALRNFKYPVMDLPKVRGLEPPPESPFTDVGNMPEKSNDSHGILQIRSSWYGNTEYPLFGMAHHRVYKTDPLIGDPNCIYCKVTKPKFGGILRFVDYRQMAAFFEVKLSDLPKNVVLHLHQQNDQDEGNPILQDVSPLKRIRDPWFRSESEFEKWDKGDEFFGVKPHNLNCLGGGAWNKKSIVSFFALCGRCLRKIERKFKVAGYDTATINTVLGGGEVHIDGETCIIHWGGGF